MEKREERTLAERTAELFDLPGDAIGALPRVELLGRHELRVENLRGLMSYGTEEIHISGGRVVIRVRGRGLTLAAMNAGEVRISGDIDGVDLE